MSALTASQGAGEQRLQITIFTIFPELIEQYCSKSVVGRAWRAGLIELQICDLRAGATDLHRSVDDAPFGGGAGMVLSVAPVFAAVESAPHSRPLFLLSPGGRRFDQSTVEELCRLGAFSLLCGRYEGVDERITEHLVDDELSVGDYVLAGGELAALVVTETVARLLPGVVGNEQSTVEESFSTGLLEYPQYTRPASFRGYQVPEVLRSGDHRLIARWRLAQSLHRTIGRRPDLIAARGGLSDDEVQLLREHGYPRDAAAPNLTNSCEDAAGETSSEERDEQ